MSDFVLDASAVIAFLNDEPGADRVHNLIPFSVVGAVNVSEVLTKGVEFGHTLATVQKSFELLGLEVIEFTYDHARKAADLRPATKKLGLSLGDRCCLALAMSLGATAVTADRTWKKLSFCPVELIR